MKQINFISSENVVNIESPKKIILFGEYTYNYDGSALFAAIDKKIVLIQKNEAVNRSNVFSKNFEAMPKEISIRINN